MNDEWKEPALRGLTFLESEKQIDGEVNRGQRPQTPNGIVQKQVSSVFEGLT
jgi:hypothetical protein